MHKFRIQCNKFLSKKIFANIFSLEAAADLLPLEIKIFNNLFSNCYFKSEKLSLNLLENDNQIFVADVVDAERE